jgi:hypothetical protein
MSEFLYNSETWSTKTKDKSRIISNEVKFKGCVTWKDYNKKQDMNGILEHRNTWMST